MTRGDDIRYYDCCVGGGGTRYVGSWNGLHGRRPFEARDRHF